MSYRQAGPSTGHRVGNWWIENLLRPAMVAGMMVCLAAPVVRTLEWMLPGWSGAYLLVFAFLASMEGILSERVLRRRLLSAWEYLGSRLAEMLVLLVLLKVANHISLGWDQLVADARMWFTDPSSFISNLDLFTAILVVPLWAMSIYLGRMVKGLDVEGERLAPPEDKTSIEYYLWMTQPPAVQDRQERLDSLAETFIWGGVAILLASLMLHILVPSTGIPAMAILLYFALGVTFLSQARFTVTYAGWQVQGIPIQASIGRRWLLWGALFLVGVVAVVLLLPTHYTMGPLQAIMGLYQLLIGGLMFLVSLIMFLVTLPFLFLFSRGEPAQRPQLPQFALPGEEQMTNGAAPPWLEILVSAVFWLIVISIVGYALIRFLRDRLGVLDESEEAAASWWGRLLLWLRGLWRQWLAWRRGVETRIRERRAERRAERAAQVRERRFLSLRRLPPRELVRYFYLSMARRAGHVGLQRAPGQTPYEYRESLDRQLPDLEPELHGLTDAFVVARYSPQPLEKEDADAVKPIWQRIKTALRRRRAGRAEQSPSKE